MQEEELQPIVQKPDDTTSEHILVNQDKHLTDLNKTSEHHLVKADSIDQTLEHSLEIQGRILDAVKEKPDVQKVSIESGDENEIAKTFWSMLRGQKGEKGELGDKGEIGSKGDKGEKGDTGEAGKAFKGSDGKDGKNGKDGRDGKDGKNGLNGTDGMDGIDGKDGKDGSPETAIDILKKIKGKYSYKDLKDAPDDAYIASIARHVSTRDYAFIELTDTPNSYKGMGGMVVAVNSTETGLVFSAGGSGAVSSVFGRTGTVVAASGDYNTSQVTENSGFLYFTNTRAIAAPLTGYVSGAGTISATDTILSAIQKLNGNIAAGSGVSSFNTRTGAVTLTSSDVTTAIGFTPYNATNPAGYTSNTGTVTSVATDSTLTGGAITTTGTLGLNLANANTWTGQQTFNTSAPVFGTMTAGSILFAGTSGLLSQNNANLFWNNSTGQLGLLTAVPTNTLTLGSTGTGMVIYNTTDQVTNFEKQLIQFNSNIFTIYGSNGGTGNLRESRFGDGADYFASVGAASLANPKFTITRVGTSTASMLLIANTGFTGSTSIIQYGIQQNLTVNQTGTAGYTVYGANVTETTTGSGPNRLISLQVGSSDRFVVANSGATTVTMNALTTTSTDGIVLQNTTASTVGTTVQQSSRLRFTGSAWNSVGAVSETDDWIIENIPVTTAGTTTSTLRISSQIAGAGYAIKLTLNSAGTIVSSANATAAAFQSTTTAANASFLVTGTGNASSTTAGLLFGGASTVSYHGYFNGQGNTTLSANVSAANIIFGSTPITMPTTGTTAWLANAVINTIGTVTNATPITITNTASLYINAASTAGTNNYAMFVDSGMSYVTGNLGVGNGTGASTPSTLIYASQSNGGGSGYTTATIKNTSSGGRSELALGTDDGDFSGFVAMAGSATTNQARQFDIGSSVNGNMGLWTNNTQRVTILGNGNVSIGGNTVLAPSLFNVGSTNQFQVDSSGNIYGSKFLGINVPIATMSSNTWTAAFQSPASTQNIVSLMRPVNTVSNLLQFVPFGTNTTTNVNWFMGTFANSDAFSFGTYDGSSSITRFSISDTGNLTINGNLSLGTAGNKLNITTGTNASVGTATLSGGTVTVSTTAVTASSKIFLTDATTGTLTNIGTQTVGTIVAGTSFVINSSNVLDTSNVNWLIIN